MLLRVTNPFPFCGVFSQNGLSQFIFKLCFFTKGKIANTLHSVISTKSTVLVFQRKWPAFFLVFKSITIWGLSVPFFYYVYHQVFSQAYAGDFIQLDCVCEKGGSSNIYSVPEASSSSLSTILQVSCSLLAPSTSPHPASPSVYFSTAEAGITLTGRLCGSAASHCDLLHYESFFFLCLFSRRHVGNAHHLMAK